MTVLYLSKLMYNLAPISINWAWLFRKWKTGWGNQLNLPARTAAHAKSISESDPMLSFKHGLGHFTYPTYADGEKSEIWPTFSVTVLFESPAVINGAKCAKSKTNSLSRVDWSMFSFSPLLPFSLNIWYSPEVWYRLVQYASVEVAQWLKSTYREIP